MTTKQKNKSDKFIEEQKRMASMLGTAIELEETELGNELLKLKKEHLNTYIQSRQQRHNLCKNEHTHHH